MEQDFQPWYPFYEDARPHLEYFDGTIYEYVKSTAEKYPLYFALEFFGHWITYSQMLYLIDECALALDNLGIKQNDVVTISLPNCPQGVIMFYALNKIGAISNMIHPLSAEGEIKFFCNVSKSKAIITLDQFYPKVKKIENEFETIEHIIIATIEEFLPFYKKLPYKLMNIKKTPKIDKSDKKVVFYKDLAKIGTKLEEKEFPKKGRNDVCSILYSGGTTGTNKGVLLTNNNFNVVPKQIFEMNQMFKPGDLFLAVMPIFHGFGLGICIHSMLANGGTALLIPRFSPKSYCQLIKKYRPNFVSGVPALFAAMLNEPTFDKIDLSCFKGMYSGGDQLGSELKQRIDTFLEAHKSTIHVREGYGMTECLTASCLTPNKNEKLGSIGIPLPDMIFKICRVGTTTEVPYGEHGEIVMSGPTVMKGYLNNEEEMKETLKVHEDGRTYLHTGDLGFMDKEGYVYFLQRLKRMIVTNGYNVYPSQIENIINSHPSVAECCVVGLDDPIRIQRIKAYIVLTEKDKNKDGIKEDILAYLKENIAKYMLPREIEYRDFLPKTKIGKIDFVTLVKEEEKK